MQDIEKKFEELHSRFSESIRRLCSGYERNLEKSQELYQDVLLGLWQSLSNFKGQCSDRTWVYRIANNIAITHVNLEINEKRLPVLSIEEVFCAQNIYEWKSNHEKEKNNNIEIINSLIVQLKPLDQEMVLLYLEGLKHAEISEIMGMTEGAVTTKLNRLKSSLSNLFSKQE